MSHYVVADSLDGPISGLIQIMITIPEIIRGEGMKLIPDRLCFRMRVVESLEVNSLIGIVRGPHFSVNDDSAIIDLHTVSHLLMDDCICLHFAC